MSKRRYREVWFAPCEDPASPVFCGKGFPVGFCFYKLINLIYRDDHDHKKYFHPNIYSHHKKGYEKNTHFTLSWNRAVGLQ